MISTIGKFVATDELCNYMVAMNAGIAPKFIEAKIIPEKRYYLINYKEHGKIFTAVYRIDALNIFKKERAVEIIKEEAREVYNLVMEKYPETLFDVFKDKSRQNEVIKILTETKKLIQRFHDLGFLHGDIHEENIVYNKTTGDVKLIDFGASMSFSEFLSLTKEKQIIQIHFRDESVYDSITPPLEFIKRQELDKPEKLEKYNDRFIKFKISRGTYG